MARVDEGQLNIKVLVCFTIFFTSVFGLLDNFIHSFFPITPRFGVDLASINSLNINGSKLTAEWDVTLFVSNPNYYHSVSYDTVSIGINYNDNHNQSLLATTLLNPFSQGSYDEDNKRFQFNMNANNDVATDIANSCSRGAINFGVVLSTSVKYKSMYHLQRVRQMKVVCEPLSFISSGSPLKGSSNWVLLRGLTCH